MADDRTIQQLVETALAGILAPNLRVRVAKGVVHLGGTVRNGADRDRAEHLAGQAEGVRAVQNDLVVDVFAATAPMQLGAETAYAVEPELLDELEVAVGPEADLNQPAGTTDPLALETEPDEPYFPPTDPVIEPLGSREGGYRVLGGYAEGAMDRPLAAEPAPARFQHSDEQIAENVRLALKEDAATTDLNLRVHVHDGVVFLHGKVQYLEDVESAEEVAGRLPGVREVREQLELE